MKISNQRLMEVAANTGFRPDVLEKVIRLVDLLNQIFASDFLRTRLVLKGGTALNLFVFEIPRLSVDIDLNYIGAIDVETQGRTRQHNWGPQGDEAPVGPGFAHSRIIIEKR